MRTFLQKPSQLARSPVINLTSRKRPKGARNLFSFTRYSSTMSRSIEQGVDEFFNYTTGRWLWGEKEQLKERYQRFNVQELKEVTAQTLGSQKCVSMTKIGEGNYNKVFRLQMDDGATAMARIPHPNAGPPRYTTSSEAATMEFVSGIRNLTYLTGRMDINRIL